MKRPVDKIKARLWAKGITYRDISRHFGVDPSMVSHSIHGRRKSRLALQIKKYIQDIIHQKDKGE